MIINLQDNNADNSADATQTPAMEIGCYKGELNGQLHAQLMRGILPQKYGEVFYPGYDRSPWEGRGARIKSEWVLERANCA